MKIKPIYEKTSEYVRASWNKAVKRRDVDPEFVMPCDYVPPCVDGDLINLYYWDTYFTNLGLIEDGETDLARGNIEDLIFCLYKFGCVPNMCRGNGATYASQPPLLFLMTKDFYVHTGDRDFLIKGYDALSLEYSFWTEKRSSPSGLNRYGSNFDYSAGDPDLTEFSRRMKRDFNVLPKEEKIAIALDRNAEGESGHDYSPRFFGRAYETNPVDLNSYLYGFERTMAEFSAILGRGEEEKWNALADKRKTLMDELCLDRETGVYFDYDFDKGERTGVYSGGSYLPFVFGLSDDTRALGLVNDRLIGKGGVFCCEKLPSDGLNYQWGYPNSWAPYNWFGFVANKRLGVAKTAYRIAEFWLNDVAETFEKTGKLYEKYDGEKGGAATVNEYGVPEMLGWTAGTFEKMLAEYKRADEVE